MQNTLITIALRGITVLPRMRIYLDMNRPMSIAAATNAQKTNQNVFLVAQKDPSVENPGQEQLEQFGVIAQVKQIIKGPEDSQFAAAAHGYRRFLCTYRMQFAYEAAGTSEIFGRISG